MVLWLATLLACGGGAAQKSGEPNAQKDGKEAEAKGKKVESKVYNPNPDTDTDKPKPMRVKIKPPFFTMPDSIARGVVGGETGRELVVPIQKGPFGGSDTLTLFYRETIEPEEGEPFQGLGLMVVVEEGAQKAGYPLQVENAAPVAGEPELLWVNSEFGWQPVLLIERQTETGKVRENQAFAWDGKKYVHSELESKIRTLSDHDEIHTAFY